jgi:hypothetical protein
MVTREAARREEIVVPEGQELIAIPDEIDGQPVVRYFRSDEEADAAFGEESIDEALAQIGSWGHLDWEETIEVLERIRQESKPTPPIVAP